MAEKEHLTAAQLIRSNDHYKHNELCHPEMQAKAPSFTEVSICDAALVSGTKLS